MWNYSVAFLVTTLCVVVAVNLPTRPGCPEPVDTRPCVCTNSPYTNLECKHIDDSEVLRRVFYNSTRYGFREVQIKYSILQYLPHDMFEKVPVQVLQLKNVTLVQLFDAPPKFLEQLDTLHIESTRLLRGVVWRLLEPLTHLRILNIYYNSIKTLNSDFSQHATKELQQLSFYDTATKSIQPGTFVKFVNLTKVAVDACQLTQLSRDIFPTPFNVRVLYFNRNKLTSIPDDMFSEMPQLQTLGLKHNQIAVLPESSFKGSLSKLEYFMLEGNPIICDCRLQWLIENKPPALSGKCAVPAEVHGREMREISLSQC